MKKNIFTLVAVIIAVLLFTSCKSVSYQARNVDVINRDIVSSPTVVDINVDLTKRVSYSDQHFVKYPQAIGKNQVEECALQAARYNCIMQNNIDVVVDPVYKISFKGKNKAKIELTGIAGYYKDPRSVYNDVKSFENIDMETVKKYLYFNNPTLIQQEGNVNITFPTEK